MPDLGAAYVLRGDARALPLPDDSVDLVVTSPPYFALRSYQDGGEHYAGQIGDEPTPAEFVDALLEVTAECARVLKPAGSIWVNLGDKYASYKGNQDLPRVGRGAGLTGGGAVKSKSLFGIPWRYAIRCIDELGLILRAEVIWSKPNGLPESVTDRVRRSHETWFHFTLQPRYFAGVDEIREEHVGGQSGLAATFARPRPSHDLVPGQTATQHRADRSPVDAANPLGKLPGSVWVVPTEPLKVPDHLGVDHFAAFPTEWPKRIIQGWSPAAVCTVCGQGRRPLRTVRTFDGAPAGRGEGSIYGDERKVTRNQGVGNWRFGAERSIVGYVCGCHEPSAPTQPAVVLDPFGGTGTTAMVARALGRTGITVDKSADYCRLAAWRTTDRNQLGKVLEIAKVAAPDEHQLDLFDV